MRARTNIATKERRSFRISNFRGVDFSSSPTRTDPSRATDMTNFICDDGTNRKRHGWAQVLEALPGGQINGIFPYQSKDGNTSLLVHVGERFYRVYQTDGGYEREFLALPTGKAVANARSQAFYQGGFLYLTCGNGCYLRYDTGQEKKIEEVEPYVPTTTVNIDPVTVEDPVRASLDPVNLLTPKRKNTLVGKKIEEVAWDTGNLLDYESVSWKLDGIPRYYSLVEVTVERIKEGTTDQIETLTFTNKEGNENGELEEPSSDKGHVFTSICGTLGGRYRQVGFFGSDGVLTLFNVNTAPAIEDHANITVTFTNAKENGATAVDNSARIKNCTFGTLFGVGGNEDRLFLSGNPDYPNVVFLSEENDFTYFPDNFTATMGTDQGAITGFLRLSDNTLATFKEARAYEPSVYYQTGEYRSFYDEDGKLKRIIPVFSIKAGAAGESALNPYTSASLVGDSLFLSRNGVFALEAAANILADVRAARERSYSVGARLTSEKALRDAVGIVFEGRYYLSVGDACYVADSRYRYQAEGSLSYHYEWWYWDHIPARVWAVVDGALWFGTEDGRLCRFDEAYTDRTLEVTQDGELSIDTETDRLTYNATAWKPEENDVITLNAEIYARYATVAEVAGGVLKVSASDITRVVAGDVVRAAGVETTYTVENVDYAACTFSLFADGALVKDAATVGMELHLCLKGKALFVTQVKNASFSLKHTREGEALDIVALEGNATARFVRCRNVVALWRTPYFDMGTNEAAKTLLKLTLSCLPEDGEVKFGYETAARLYEAEARGTGAFSFEDIDFNRFSFDTGFQNSYSVKVRERNFNYICFRFLSDTDKSCSLNDLTAIYKINKRNLGVV